MNFALARSPAVVDTRDKFGDTLGVIQLPRKLISRHRIVNDELIEKNRGIPKISENQCPVR
jgi:hypothetical protein